MDSAVVVNNSTVPVRGSWPWRIAVVAVLTALADWLLFRENVGISLALLVLAVGAGVILANQVEADRRTILLNVCLLALAVLPMIEHFNFLSALIATFGLVTFALGVMTGLRGELKDKVIAVGWHLLSGPYQFFRDLPLFRQWAQQRGTYVSLATVKGWIVPLAFGAIFVALFAAANPLIANYLTQWNLGDEVKQLDLLRLPFWLGSVIVIWMFINVGQRFAHPDDKEFVAAYASIIRLVWPPLVRPDGKELVAAAAADVPSPTFLSLIFNDAALMRSLVLFNLLFAMQSIMDIQYLWAGAALPDGMTYASYAHRGAYPLILTALLAAGFVVVAMRPGSDAVRSPIMRAMVFLWVGQNVLLVVSSILRLDLYVAVYSLTYLRVAAFVWMLIVAAGLVLIVARIVTYRSNAWLVSANIAVLALTLYGCSFVNFPNLVANHNVDHARDMAGAGQTIDIAYIVSLGPHAIPALDRYVAARTIPYPAYFVSQRGQLVAAYLKDSTNWRAWTFRSWRLTRYLEQAKAPY